MPRVMSSVFQFGNGGRVTSMQSHYGTLTMKISRNREKLSKFLDSGIYRFEDSNSFFIDPVRVLNNSYARFRVCPSKYYSRFFEPVEKEPKEPSSNPKKRKRKERKKERPYELNEREQLADRRHQEAKPMLLKACESMLGADDLLECMRDSRNVSYSSVSPPKSDIQQSFVDLGSVWQAHLYDITLRFHRIGKPVENGGGLIRQSYEQIVPLFNNLIVNETCDEVEAEFMNTRYILPRESCFYMSDLKEVHNLIPAENDFGFDLIVIDPPWENGSARQKSRYPTLPNRYFLSLPIKQLGHKEGALIALWVTNREKLRCFVEEELFPSWGVKYMATFYWLKVKADGSPISDLDLFHHRPYECLLLGQCNADVLDCKKTSRIKPIPDNQVIISIPGDYSRKPPIGGILKEYVTGHSPSRALELFAREMNPGWVSWGNEPLRYQDSSFFNDHKEAINTAISPLHGTRD